MGGKKNKQKFARVESSGCRCCGGVIDQTAAPACEYCSCFCDGRGRLPNQGPHPDQAGRRAEFRERILEESEIVDTYWPYWREFLRLMTEQGLDVEGALYPEVTPLGPDSSLVTMVTATGIAISVDYTFRTGGKPKIAVRLRTGPWPTSYQDPQTRHALEMQKEARQKSIGEPAVESEDSQPS